MRRISSYSALLLFLSLYVVGLAVALFGLSSYFFSDVSTTTQYDEIAFGLRDAQKLLEAYQTGKLNEEDVKSAVNPVLNGNGVFYMLLDENRQVIAYTENAAPYFAGNTLPALLGAADREASAAVRTQEGRRSALLMGQKTQYGYVLAGRRTQAVFGAAFSFRVRMLLSVCVTLLIMLAISFVTTRKAARPARMIIEMAGRLTEGEQIKIPENLPDAQTRQIAKALNYMSSSVTRAINDVKYEKETMSLILEGLSEGILAIDEEGRILHENAAAWQLIGSEETAAYRSVMEALKENRKEDQWGRKYFGEENVLFIAVSRLPQEEGKPGHRGTVALIRDITEQERLERTRYDYVANISHELRTPLASIRGLGEGLRDGLVAEEKDRQRYYSIIVNEVTRLSRLVNDLLELSSLQSNPAAFEMERVDPNELIYDLHDRNGSLFTEKKLTFVRSLPQEPLKDIRSNEDRLSQVLTIFLDNARKYTKEGGEVTLGAEKAEGGVRFFVRDTGIGMDEETQRLAFERFHQAERGRSDKGSGLGLSIAREILQKMNVDITVVSAPGKGSEFSFVIQDSCI